LCFSCWLSLFPMSLFLQPDWFTQMSFIPLRLSWLVLVLWIPWNLV
jgi:hypothetical protein